MAWTRKKSAISLVILVLKLTISVNNGEVRVVDVGRVASKVICQGTTLKFKCENTSLAMVIYAATYGREEDGRTLCPFRQGLVDQSVILANETDDTSVCPEMNVTSQIMKLCDKKRRCIVTVNATYFGNHCKGIYKFLKVIYACVNKHELKIRTIPLYTTTPSYSTAPFTSPTPPVVKHKTPKVTPTRKRVTTLTKRKKTRTNSTVRKSRTRTTKAPMSTKHTTAPKRPVKTTSKISIVSTKEPVMMTNKSTKVTPTTLPIVTKPITSKKPDTVSKGISTVKPNITVLKSDASVPITIPVVSTNTTKTNDRDKKTKTPTTSAGVQITIQVNGTDTSPNGTESSIPTTVRPIILTTRKGPLSKAVSSAAPVVMQQARPEVVMGVAGSLYLWFLHMKENSSTYLTVFLLSALAAAIIMVAVVACFLTLQKKKDFLKLDIMHKPKRYIAPPKETKTTKQNGHVPGKGEKLADAEEAPDGIILPKGPEIVFTAHDVNNHVPKEFNIDRYSGMENGTAKKDDGTDIHVNPMFNSGNNNNKAPSSVTNPNPINLPGNGAISSLPSTPCRSRTLSEPKSGTPRRDRAYSTGNVSRSHERHHSQGMTNYPDERVRLPRHLSAGNVSPHNRQGLHSDHASQNQSPARTLPRQRAATGNGGYCHSPVRNPHNWPPSAQPAPVNGMSNSGIVNTTSQPQSPARSVSGGTLVNQYPSASGSLNNRQQKPGSESQQPSNVRSAQYNSLGHPTKQLGPGTAGRDGESNYQGKPPSLGSEDVRTTPSSQHSMSYQRPNPNSTMKSSNPSNTLSSDSNAGAPTPYSNHRNSPNLNRKWSKEKPTNDGAPNIITNPNYNNKPGDIWQKHNGVKSGQKDASAKSFSADQGNTSGSVLQCRNVSSERCSPQEQDANKGTMRPPSMGELLSPLDAMPDTYANNSSLLLSERHSYNITPGTSSFHPFTPPPPELPTDSSDDDLYSIVAKGTYSSAEPDPNLRHTGMARSDGRERKNKSKHVYVVIPSGDGSTAV
ncbi:uncharacterized protein LOC144656015 isoform X2 [Oculina patagonica]